MRFSMSFLIAMAIAAPVAAEVPRVVTDFGPTQSLAAQVMGNLGAPVMLLALGADPHDFQMKPSQAQALAGADLVFWVGPELTPALEHALAALGENARAVALLHLGGGTRRSLEGGAIDPHAWLDPANAEAWLATIATELARQDPEHAATYTANAAAAQAALQALDAELAARLAPVQGRPFVVFHDALGYFADHYGLQVVGAIELGDAAAPGAAQLAHIRGVVAEGGAICVFPEAGRDPKFIATVTAGSSARIGAAQDIEAITLPPGPGLYPDLLRALAGTLTDCLSAAPDQRP
ncbi:MAG: hypothetical protein AUK60_03820 [Rhodobacteraceae bacterium CG2_30_10_405]|nr:zinc ABC transporter solute-binding protein [Rhodobacterales bacterium]OIQ06994.1 MAG: hypothetical protein AUK60_03820 [Rhodobacteraceae bacterium CG2_30_10_405]